MTTNNHSIREARFLRQVLGGVASVLLAAGVQAQQVSTVISTNLLDPNYVTADPNNNIYFTDASNNRIVEYVPATNGVLTFAGGDGPAYAGSINGAGLAARFSQPLGIVYDPYRGGLVVVDSGNQVLRFVTLGGAVTNLAGVEATPSNMNGGFSDGLAAKAQFSSFMAGIAADGAGNLFIADAGNNAIRRLGSNNIVSTIQVTNYTFNQPTALALDKNTNLWVADTKNDTICLIHNINVISNQSVTIMAGTLLTAGTNDSLTAANALFSLPSGLLWDPNGAGLFISDTGNHTIRRLWPNVSLGGAFSVQTVAGLPADKGFVDGALNLAQFDNPVGLAVDAINNGYYVVDRANNALRRLQSTAPQPPVADPVIGYVTFITPSGGGTPVSLFNPATNEIFNNAVIIAIKAEAGVETYMTFGPTPLNSYLNTIPTPGPTTGTSPQIYAGDGNAASATFPSVLAPQPDVTMYVISEASGRAASDIVSARFQFITANPNIGGNNGEVVTLTDNTTSALMWYTLDGSSPTNDGSNGIGPITNGQVISFQPITNTTLTVVAFADGFTPSGTVVEVFSPTNFVANAITFGFVSGEASSEFVGAAGARFYAPVTLTLLPGATMYSLQFNVTINSVANAPALPVVPTFEFDSMLSHPVQFEGLTVYPAIPPAMFDGTYITNVFFAPGTTNLTTNLVPILDTLLFTNAPENLLGVGWLEIAGETNLYPATSQDLITYSIAHETLFSSSSGEVIVGAYSFVIPANALPGQQYQIQLGRPSADGDGFDENVFIETPTNGSLGAGAINSIKRVTVGALSGSGLGVTPYLVGDVVPFRWFNAGDFGDDSLLNNDVLETFRYAVYGLTRVLPGSDFADAYDSSDGTVNTNNFGNASAIINSIEFGDGVVDVSDVFVTYQRSLDPGLTWYERYWSNGVKYAQAVTNSNPTSLTPVAGSKPTPARASVAASAARSITVGADRVQGAAGQTVQVPIRVLAADSLPLTVIMLNVTVVPLGGSPALTNTVSFTPGAGLGPPTMTDSQGANNYAAAWLDATAAGISGTSVIGTVTVILPPNVTANSSYLVHFQHFSASPNGIATFHSTIQDGLITVGGARTASSWNDGIPDWWRLIYFGTISNVLSAASLDPDADGASNWQEYVAGTNPEDPTSVLQLTGSLPLPNFTVQWPSVVGKTYQVQSSTSLFSTNWTIIGSNLSGTGQTMQLSDTNLPAPPAKFYRVQVQ
jgi:sugar lactone lactonase YvrE/chitodextrinase